MCTGTVTPPGADRQCLSELAAVRIVRGETTPDELRAVDAHCEQCPPCAGLLRLVVLLVTHRIEALAALREAS